MCLAHILASLAQRLKFKVGVCSVDHGLRPEAASEVTFVERFAKQLNLPFHPRTIEVAQGASLQAQAREARYRALFEVCTREDYNLVATGHTQDDQAETVLHRILRSGTVAGLVGIAARRADGVIRPLLGCSRQAVEAYARRHEIDFVRDPSNDDLRFERVRIRRVLETMRKDNPEITQRLAELAEDAADCRDAIAALSGTVEIEEDWLDRARLLTLPRAAAKEVIARWVSRHCKRVLGSQMQRQAYDLACLGRGELWLSEVFTLRVKADSLYLDVQRRLP